MIFLLDSYCFLLTIFTGVCRVPVTTRGVDEEKTGIGDGGCGVDGGGGGVDGGGAPLYPLLWLPKWHLGSRSTVNGYLLCDWLL